MTERTSGFGRDQTGYSQRDKDLLGVDGGQKGPVEHWSPPISISKHEFNSTPLPQYDHSHERTDVCLRLLRPIPESIPDLARRYKLMTKYPILYSTLTKILLQAANENLCRHHREFDGDHINHFFRLNKEHLKKRC